MDRQVMGEFAAAGDTDLVEDRLEVVLDGVGADAQARGDLPRVCPAKTPSITCCTQAGHRLA